MNYVPQVWVDNVTPADAAHMNFIEGGIAAAVPQDGAVVAGTRILSSKLLAADAQPAFRIFGDGKHEWGPGGATAPSTNLYLETPTVLRTDSHFVAGQQVHSFRSQAASIILTTSAGAPMMYFGNALDTNLYRPSADLLKTDDNFQIGLALYIGSAGDSWITRNGARYLATNTRFDYVLPSAGATALAVMVDGDPVVRWYMDSNGKQNWGPGNAGVDTNFYRSAASVLKTDQNLAAGVDVYARAGSATEMRMGNVGALAGLWFAGDTSIYRYAAGDLKTDGVFAAADLQFTAPNVSSEGLGGYVAGQRYFYVRGDGLLAWMPAGASPDTYLYRAGVGQLKTDTTFFAGADIYARVGGGTTQTIVGNIAGLGGIQAGGDTSFVRWGANQWRASGDLLVASTVYTGGNVISNSGSAAQTQIGASPGGFASIAFGSPIDNYIYRVGANSLKTDGVFTSGSGLYVSPSAADSNSRIEIWVSGEAARRFYITGTGVLNFGSGAVATDTSLYRGGVKQLVTDASFASLYDAGANASPFTFYFNNAGANRQILVGAADSGGAGYRMLRILN